MRYLFLFIFVLGCSHIDSFLFGAQQTSTSISDKEDPQKKEIFFQKSKFESDFYGRPIFSAILNSSKNSSKEALYYALKQSEKRTGKNHYLLVGKTKSSKRRIQKELKNIQNQMIKIGVSKDKIFVLTETGLTSQKYDEIHLYER